MAFQLTISEGKESGREFLFEQPSVTIGRTPECDICLYDPGVSRKHARIFYQADGYYIEDMGSSNGTLVNGQEVKKVKLSTGDALALGTVVFSFATQEELPKLDTQHTRIVAVDPDRTRPKAKVQLLAGGASEARRDQLARSATTSLPSLRAVRANAAAAAEGAPAPRSSTGGLSAAERARIRRQSGGAVASAKIVWAESGRGLRGLVYTLVVLALLGAVGYAGWYEWVGPNRTTGPSKPEPMELGNAPVEDSFGYDPGVTFEHTDRKIFNFTYNAPVKAVVLMYFQAKDIAQGEVQVFVNGAPVAMVPPDTLDVAEHQNEIRIPPNLLKKGEVNKIVFDNLKNPPGNDTWEIWNIRVETDLLPQMPPDQLLREAQDAFQQGLQDFERRDIGAENRFLAWKMFRRAWLMLEGYPGAKPELYALAQQRMRAAQKELDRVCSQLLLSVESAYNQKNLDAARSTLDSVNNYFPTNHQPCPYRARKERYQLGL